jgi:hypothetical protein
MGFWSGLLKAIEVVGKAAAESPHTWYLMGKQDGLDGNVRRTYLFKTQNIAPELLKTYDDGYDEGRAERSAKKR